MYIYLTKNLVNGKIYIGQSSKDSNKSKRYLGSGSRILKAIKKYGRENFIKIILKDNISNVYLLAYYEIFYISLYNSQDQKIGYNIQSGGKQPDYKNDRKYDPKRYKNHSEFLKNLERSEEWRNNISKSLKGHKHSESTKRKLSLKKKGTKNKSATRLFKIFDDNNNLVYVINGYFNEFCKENDLPSSVLNKSIQNNGSRIYMNCSVNSIKPKYQKFIGWYAVSTERKEK